MIGRTAIALTFLLGCSGTTTTPSTGPSPSTGPASQPQQDKLSLDVIWGKFAAMGTGIQQVGWSKDGNLASYLKPSKKDPEVSDLWAFDVRTGQQRLLVRSADLSASGYQLTQEERARGERKRARLRGISEYVWSPDSRALLFPLAGELYHARLDGSGIRRLTHTAKAELDPKFSPDGRFVSFVRAGDLFLVDLKTGQERALTTGATKTRQHGVADFIAQEEMGLFTGYWWSADAKHIAYFEVDLSPVSVRRWLRLSAKGTAVQTQRYPSAGGNNSRVRVGVVSVETGKTRWTDISCAQQCYIARLKWLPASGEKFTVQVQSRDQKKLQLLLVDSATGQSTRILEETDAAWVELHDNLTFLPGSDRFVWSSERSGSNQLYLYSLEGVLVRQLTRGAARIVGVAGVDPSGQTVYYTAVTNQSRELHLFRVGVDGTAPVRLTREPGWHQAQVAPTSGYFIDSHSRVHQPPAVVVRDLGGVAVKRLSDAAAEGLVEQYNLVPAEFVQFEAEDRTRLNGLLIRPRAIEAGRRCPVVIYVYGGPQGHSVADRWRKFNLWGQFLAQRGYVYFAFDNRGTGYRSRRFEKSIYQRFGDIEIRDLERAVAYLKELPYVDGSRIGIWGWSYGGYLVLMGLSRTRGLLRAGVAVAPVTDWHLYDTHYTERHLGHPDAFARVYRQASVLTHASGLEGALLLAHGMADDNVLFEHSVRLIHKLQRLGKHFSLSIYPGKAHSLKGRNTRVHLFEEMTRFFDRNL